MKTTPCKAAAVQERAPASKARRAFSFDEPQDILEPHDDSRGDTWAKAKGLAAFADLHGMEFGRLIIARKQGDAFEKADMNDKKSRQKARIMQSQSDLESLFSP